MSRSESELAGYSRDEAQELEDHEFTLDADDDLEITQPTLIVRKRSHAQPPPPPPPRAAGAGTGAGASQRVPTRTGEFRTTRHATDSGVFQLLQATDRAATTVEPEVARLRAQMRARDAYLGELERALEDHARQLAAAGLDGFEDLARLLGRVRGQAFRIAELESDVRNLTGRLAERAAQPGAVSVTPRELRRVRGIGPRFAEQLATQGVTTVEQIARWTEDDASRFAAVLHIAPARIAREAWIEQARALLGEAAQLTLD
jgi:predicted flap endonuclease-1-like 5' DNA nuclease